MNGVPLLTVCFKKAKNYYGEKSWKAMTRLPSLSYRTRLCYEGVQNVLDVPEEAKRLHFTVYGEKQRDAKCVLPVKVFEKPSDSYYTNGLEWHAELDGVDLDETDIPETLKGFMLRNEDKKTFYIVAEWE